VPPRRLRPAVTPKSFVSAQRWPPQISISPHKLDRGLSAHWDSSYPFQVCVGIARLLDHAAGPGRTETPKPCSHLRIADRAAGPAWLRRWPPQTGSWRQDNGRTWYEPSDSLG